MLPRAQYRQWTLSLPIRLRWALARNGALCSDVLSLFVRTLFNALRARARSLALAARECGAVSFIQRFGSALQLNVHFHVLVPEGVFADDGAVHPLPPPEDADVESLLETFLRRLVPLLERYGLHELEALPEHALDALQLSSAQWKLPLASPRLTRPGALNGAPPSTGSASTPIPGSTITTARAWSSLPLRSPRAPLTRATLPSRGREARLADEASRP